MWGRGGRGVPAAIVVVSASLTVSTSFARSILIVVPPIGWRRIGTPGSRSWDRGRRRSQRPWRLSRRWEIGLVVSGTSAAASAVVTFVVLLATAGRGSALPVVAIPNLGATVPALHSRGRNNSWGSGCVRRLGTGLLPDWRRGRGQPGFT